MKGLSNLGVNYNILKFERTLQFGCKFEEDNCSFPFKEKNNST